MVAAASKTATSLEMRLAYTHGGLAADFLAEARLRLKQLVRRASGWSPGAVVSAAWRRQRLMRSTHGVVG